MIGVRSTVARGVAGVLDQVAPARMPWNAAGASLPPVGTGARPVVLQGGIATDPSMYEPMRRFLTSVGFDVTIARSPNQTLGSIRNDAHALGQAVEAASLRSARGGGDGLVTVFAHSKGGLIARDYIQNLGGIDRVGELVTSGTPHQGFTLLHPRVSSLAGRVVPNSAFRDLESTNGVAAQLNRDLPRFMDDAATRQPGFRMVSLAGDVGIGNDGLITVPSTRLPQARNVEHHVIGARGANHGSIAGCILGLHGESARTAANLLAGHSLEASVANARTGASLLRAVPSS